MSSMTLAQLDVGANAGKALVQAGGPVVALAGVAVAGVTGVAVCGAVMGIEWLFNRANRNKSGDSPTPNPKPQPPGSRVVREASVTLSQQSGGSSQSGGSGQDPNWWNNIIKNDDCSTPLEIFQRIVQEILARLKGAGRSERLVLLKKLREALANLLKSHPDINIYIEAGTRTLVLDVPDGDAIEIRTELVEAFGVYKDCGRDLGVGDANRPCIYRIRCTICLVNYVGQAQCWRQRKSTHKASMNAKAKPTSLSQHHKQTCCLFNCKCDFEDLYDCIVLTVLDSGSKYRQLRPFETFWQWLMKALQDDEGIGKQ